MDHPADKMPKRFGTSAKKRRVARPALWQNQKPQGEIRLRLDGLKRTNQFVVMYQLWEAYSKEHFWGSYW